MILYLTSSGAVGAVRKGKARPATAECVGPSGRAFSIMRKPRPDYGELLDGRVLAFTPPLRLFEAVWAAREGDGADAAWEVYEAALRARWTAPSHLRRLLPGELRYALPARRYDPEAADWDGERWAPGPPLGDGDTLCCGCGAETARAGRCHRVIAAELLRSVGWDVVLDGRRLT